MRRIQTLPAVTVALDGAPLAHEVAAALAEVRVRQALSLPTQCELVFRDPPGPLEAAARARPGARLGLTVHGHRTALFGGEVTAVEHVFDGDAGREVRLRAYDPSHRLRRRQTARVQVRVSARDLAAELVRDLGLTVRAAEDGPRHEWLIQHDRSDLDTLVATLERCGLFYTVRDAELHLVSLAGTGEPLPLELGATLLEARGELNAEGACSEVEVAGWDPLRGRAHRGRATRGAAGGRRAVWDQALAGPQHADALARAELDARAAGEVRLWGVAEGDPRLRPAARVVPAGLGEAFAGLHVLTTVTHTLDEQRGYVATFDTEPPRRSPRPPAAVVTEAIVTQVRDPERRGRVKARLPGYLDAETDWMPVVTLGAGSGKGLQVQPDVDDLVLVLLAQGNPAQGVVMGGLYGAHDVPDGGGVVGGSVRRFALRTPGGQVVRLDDERGSVTVEDHRGSLVELAPDRVRLHATTDLEIGAPGHRVVIRGRAIDFETA